MNRSTFCTFETRVADPDAAGGFSRYVEHGRTWKSAVGELFEVCRFRRADGDQIRITRLPGSIEANVYTTDTSATGEWELYCSLRVRRDPPVVYSIIPTHPSRYRKARREHALAVVFDYARATDLVTQPAFAPAWHGRYIAIHHETAFPLGGAR